VGQDPEENFGLPPMTQADEQKGWGLRQVSDPETPPPAQFGPPKIAVTATQTGSTPAAGPFLQPGSNAPEVSLSHESANAIGEDPSKPKRTWSQVIGDMLKGFGAGASGGKSEGWSDVRLKQDVRPARGEAQALLRTVAGEGPMSYRYKEEVGVPGEQFGPMAQTLEKGGPMGAAMVKRDAGGMRYLDGVAMQKASLALIAEQQRQLEEIKDRLAGGGGGKKVAGWFTQREASAAPRGRAVSAAEKVDDGLADHAALDRSPGLTNEMWNVPSPERLAVSPDSYTRSRWKVER
jgi:hypothetical protein